MDYQSFERCRGTCAGPVFIVACGPSAKEFPLQRFAGIPMMAVNGSILRFTDAGLKPFFYLCDDSSFVRNRLPLLMEATRSAERLALSPRVVDALLEREPTALKERVVYRFDRVNRPIEGQGALSDRQFARLARRDPDFECNFSWLRQKPNRIGFSRNMSKGYFSSRTIPYAGIQLAYHLGFSKVFLVGVDLDSSAGRFYESGEAAVPSRLDGDYDEYILPCFELMAERVVGPGFQVYNLSLESRLPASVVPKLTPAQLDALLASP